MSIVRSVDPVSAITISGFSGRTLSRQAGRNSCASRTIMLTVRAVIPGSLRLSAHARPLLAGNFRTTSSSKRWVQAVRPAQAIREVARRLEVSFSPVHTDPVDPARVIRPAPNRQRRAFLSLHAPSACSRPPSTFRTAYFPLAPAAGAFQTAQRVPARNSAPPPPNPRRSLSGVPPILVPLGDISPDSPSRQGECQVPCLRPLRTRAQTSL